jgi:hypothetical protein
VAWEARGPQQTPCPLKGWHFHSGGDIPRQQWDERRWNGWRLDGLELVYGNDVYPVDLEACTSSAGVLDIIIQVAHKTWANDACLAGLVRALDDILQPQARLCSGGADKRITTAKIRAERSRHAQITRDLLGELKQSNDRVT